MKHLLVFSFEKPDGALINASDLKRYFGHEDHMLLSITEIEDLDLFMVETFESLDIEILTKEVKNGLL